MNKLTLKVSEIKNNSLCLTCGVDFYSRKKCATRTPKYCSKECYAESLKKYKVCGQCNKSFAKCSNKTYCSVECRNNSRRGTKLNSKWRAALSEGRKNSEKCKGPNLYNWKGGKDTLAERMRLHANNRRSSQKIKLDAAFMDRLLLAQKGRCFYCEEVLTYKAIEHLTPLSRGGDNQKYNLVYSCKSCNSKKRTKTMEEYAIYTGNLYWIDKFDIIFLEAKYAI